jgi:hypothetical protein
MPFPSRLVLIVSAACVLALCAGCAALPAEPIPQGDIPPEEVIEPLPAGIKPLTLEQEEMISQ